MTATAAPPRPRLRNRSGIFVVLAGLGAVVVLALMMVAVRSPAMVDEITVVNDSGSPLLVTASGGDSSSVLPLGTVDAGGRTHFREVLDQGDEWRFQLRVGPDDVGELHRSRARLDADGWTITIPSGVTSEPPGERR